MRIVDSDTHIAPVGGNFDIENLIGNMEHAKIDRALVWLTPIYNGKEIEDYLRYVKDSVTQHAEKLIGFGWTDPTISVDHAKDMVKKCVDYGFHGIKMNGAQNNYIIDSDELALPVIEEIAKQDKALAFHIGDDFYENTHPLRAARIAKLFPEMPILMVHMGMNDTDMVNSVIREAVECTNMLLIGSNTKVENVRLAVDTLGAERVCYGSDSPFRHMKAARVGTEAVIEDLSEDERRMIMGENLLRSLGIE